MPRCRHHLLLSVGVDIGNRRRAVLGTATAAAPQPGSVGVQPVDRAALRGGHHLELVVTVDVGNGGGPHRPTVQRRGPAGQSNPIGGGEGMDLTACRVREVGPGSDHDLGPPVTVQVSHRGRGPHGLARDRIRVTAVHAARPVQHPHQTACRNSQRVAGVDVPTEDHFEGSVTVDVGEGRARPQRVLQEPAPEQAAIPGPGVDAVVPTGRHDVEPTVTVDVAEGG